MTEMQKCLMKLIKSTVTGEKQVLPDVMFDSVAAIAEYQEISTLIYDGAVTCGIDENYPAMKRLLDDCIRHIVVGNMQAEQLSEIADCFSANDIDYLLMKGAVVKDIYPKPNLRVMGDIDILIRDVQYKKIAPLMDEMGYKFSHESDHEYIWSKGGNVVELHKCPVPTYDYDYYSYFGDGWKFALPGNRKNEYVLSHEDVFIFIFTHFAKHYRDRGIGCRHVTDIWVCKSVWQDMDEEYLVREFQKLGLDKFYENVMTAINAWFGDGEENEATDIIAETVFQSYAFGDRKFVSASIGLREAKMFNGSENAKRNHIISSVFPALDKMCLRYRVLRKAPALLPAFWLVRIAETLIFHRDRIEPLWEDAENYSTEEIEQYRKKLNDVGLDFNFK